ncbi:EF-Tu/IF-2/RF-3 family GTPase [Patescibacteria group bacterium]|nr:EF-Tu/IF-2/RF-3 family GTPase [Patescibacteria group bacterium]
MDIQIGRITHYYDKIGVAVVSVMNQPLKVGDTVKISGHDSEFTQDITSLQVEHAKVPEVAAGDSCGLKVDQPVKEGDRIFLIGHS